MRLALPVLATLCALVLFAGLGRTGLFDQREARDAQVARELVANREALTPLLGREPLFEKPILAYAQEAAARLGSRSPGLRSREFRALVAVLLVIVTASVAAEHFGPRAGWASALVLASTVGLPLASRTDGTQLLGSLFGWVGCSGLADAVFGRSAGRGFRLVVAYAALAAALLCAGALPALWPLAGLALYLALARLPDGWKRARPIAGLALVAGLALPWYGAMIERHGATFLAYAPFFPYGIEPRGLWYSGPVLMLSFLVVGFFPWSSLLPGAFFHAATWWRPTRARSAHAGTGVAPGAAAARRSPFDPLARERREEGAAHFFTACLIAALAPIVIYPSPPLPAALPALPAAAILCGRFIDHLLEDPERLAAPLGRAVTMLALLGGVGGLLLALVATRVPEAAAELRLLGTLLFVASWAPFLANFLGRRRLAAGLMMLPAAIGAPVASLRLLPAMESYLNTRQVAEAMAAVSPPRAVLVLAEPPAPSLRLYGENNLVVGAPLSSAIEAHRASDGLAYVAFRPSREQEVVRAARGPIEILARTPSLVLARVHRG